LAPVISAEADYVDSSNDRPGRGGSLVDSSFIRIVVGSNSALAAM